MSRGFACAANEATLSADQRRGNQRQPGGEFRGGGQEAGQQGTTGAKVGVGVGVGWRLIPAAAATFSPNLRFSQDFFGKSDPYLEFYKQTATGWQLAHRTEVNPFAE